MFTTLMPLTWNTESMDGADMASALFPSSNSITSRNATVCSTFIFSQQNFTSSSNTYLSFHLNMANGKAPVRPLTIGMGMPGSDPNTWNLEYGFQFVNNLVYAMSLDPVSQVPVLTSLGLFNSTKQFLLTWTADGTFRYYIKNPADSLNTGNPTFEVHQQAMYQMPLSVMIEMCDRSYLTNIDYGTFNPTGVQLYYNDVCPCQNNGVCVPQLTAPYFTCICGVSQFYYDGWSSGGGQPSFYGALCNQPYLYAGLGNYQCPIGWNNFPICNYPTIPANQQAACGKRFTSSSSVGFVAPLNGTYLVSLWGASGGPGGGAVGGVAGGNGAYMSALINMRQGDVYDVTAGKAGGVANHGNINTPSCTANTGGCGGASSSVVSSYCNIGSGGQHSVIYLRNNSAYTMYINAAGGTGGAWCSGQPTSGLVFVNGISASNVTTTNGTACILSGSTIAATSGKGGVGSDVNGAILPRGGGGGGCSGGSTLAPAGSFYKQDSVQLIASESSSLEYDDYTAYDSYGVSYVPCTGANDPFAYGYSLSTYASGCGVRSSSTAGVVYISPTFANFTLSVSTVFQGYYISSGSCPTNLMCGGQANFQQSTGSCQCAFGFYDRCINTYCEDPGALNSGYMSSDCNEQGTCVMTAFNGTCYCNTGYFGEGCEFSNPCILNSTSCSTPFVCSNTTTFDPVYGLNTNGFVCTCPDGFYGNACQYENVCLTQQPCQNGGACSNTIDSSSYTCNCLDGFSGTNCQTVPYMFTTLMPLTWIAAATDGANSASAIYPDADAVTMDYVIFPDDSSISSRNATVCSTFVSSQQQFTSYSNIYLSFHVNSALGRAPARDLKMGVGTPSTNLAQWNLSFGFDFSNSEVYAMSLDPVLQTPISTLLGLFDSTKQYLITYTLDGTFNYYIKNPAWPFNSSSLVYSTRQQAGTQMPFSVMTVLCDKSFITRIDYGTFYPVGTQLSYNDACPCLNNGICVPQSTAPYYTCVCFASQESIGFGYDDASFFGTLCQTPYLYAGVNFFQCPLGLNNFPVCNLPTIPIHTQQLCSVSFTEVGPSQFTPPVSGLYLVSLWGASGGNTAATAGGAGAYMSVFIDMLSSETYYLNVGTPGLLASSGALETASCPSGSLGGCGGSSGSTGSAYGCAISTGGQHSAIYLKNGTYYTLMANAAGGNGAADCYDSSNPTYASMTYPPGISALPTVTHNGANPCVLSNPVIGTTSGLGDNGVDITPSSLPYGGGGGGCGGGSAYGPAGSYYSPITAKVQLNGAEYVSGTPYSINAAGRGIPCSGENDVFVEYLQNAANIGCGSSPGSAGAESSIIMIGAASTMFNTPTLYSTKQGFYATTNTVCAFGVNACPTYGNFQASSSSYNDVYTYSCACAFGTYDNCFQDYCYDPGAMGSGYLSNDCNQQGTCVTTALNGTCYCLPGYFGLACEFTNPCILNPTSCASPLICSNTTDYLPGSGYTNGFECGCPDGYYGSSCQYINTCLVSQPCKNQAICTNTLNSSAYQCQCLNGYHGTNCDIPFGLSVAPYSSSQTPFSSSQTPYSSSLTPFSSSLAPFSSSATPASSSQTPYSSSQTPTTQSPTTSAPTTQPAPYMFTSLMPLVWDVSTIDGANGASVIFPDTAASTQSGINYVDDSSITSRNATVCSTFAFSNQYFTPYSNVYLSFHVNAALGTAPRRDLKMGVGMPSLNVALWNFSFGFEFSNSEVYASSLDPILQTPISVLLGLFDATKQYLLTYTLDGTFNYYIKNPAWPLNSTSLVYTSKQNAGMQMPMSVMTSMCDMSYLTRIDYGVFYPFGVQLSYNDACPCLNNGICVPQSTAPYYTCVCSTTMELVTTTYDQPSYFGTLCQTPYLPSGVIGYQCPIGLVNFPACDTSIIPQNVQGVCSRSFTLGGTISIFIPPTNNTYTFSLWGGGGGGAPNYVGGGGAYMSVSINTRKGDRYYISTGSRGVNGIIGQISTQSCSVSSGGLHISGCGGSSGLTASSNCAISTGGGHSSIHIQNGTTYSLVVNAAGGSGSADCSGSSNPSYNSRIYPNGVSGVPSVTNSGGGVCVLTNTTIYAASGLGGMGIDGTLTSQPFGGGGGGCSGGNASSPAGSYYNSAFATLINSGYTVNALQQTNPLTGADIPCSGAGNPFYEYILVYGGCQATQGVVAYGVLNGNISVNLSTTYNGFFISGGNCDLGNIICPLANYMQPGSPTSCEFQPNVWNGFNPNQYCSDPGLAGSGYMSLDCNGQGTCVVFPLNGTCYCQSGYYGLACEFTNQCILNPGSCTSPFTCSNTTTYLPGSGYTNGYVCDCPDGYYGSSCQYENTCLVSQPCQNQGICHSVTNSAAYTCQCLNGYTGTNCQTIPPYSSSQTPYSSSLTPFSSSQTPISSSLTPFSSSQTPASSSLTPFSSSLTPFSSSQTPISSSLTPFSSSQTPASSSLTPFSSSQIPFSSSGTPIQVTCCFV